MGRYRNPILPGCHPDPSICRFGDRFVLVTSTFEYLPGLPVHVSDDLVHWELAGHVIDRVGQLDLRGIPSSSGLYAPTVRVIGDRLVVVCTVVGPDHGSWPGRTGHVLFWADDPAGPWSDPLWIDGVGGFDPSLTVDGDRVWLCETRQPREPAWAGQTEVWLSEIDLVTGALRTEPRVVWGGAAIGAVWAEGPHILPRPGGGWMLVAAEGGTDLDHAVCVAYADEITGPYVGDPGNPRLTHRDLGETAAITAVGHADLVTDAAGRSWATVLATHPVGGRRGLLGRRTSLVPVGWEHDRPLFAPGSGRVEAVVTAAGIPDQAPRERTSADDFVASRFGPLWHGVGRTPDEVASLAERPGHARLRGGAGPDSADVVFLGCRVPEERVVVTARIELHPEGDDFRAGLLLRVSEEQHLEVAVDGAGRVRVGTARGGVPVADPSSLVDLGAAFDVVLSVHDLRARVVVAGRHIAEVDIADLAPRPPRGFIGAFVGPYAVGAGFCDVDRVEVEAQAPVD